MAVIDKYNCLFVGMYLSPQPDESTQPVFRRSPLAPCLHRKLRGKRSQLINVPVFLARLQPLYLDKTSI